MQSEDNNRIHQRIFDSMSDGLILTDVESGLIVETNLAAAAMHGYSRKAFIGLPLSDFIQFDSYAKFAEWVEAVQAGDAIEAMVVHIHRDGTPFTVDVRGTGFIYQDRPCLLSIVRNVEARVRQELLVRQQMESRLNEQAALLEQAKSLAALEERRRLAQNLHDAVNQSLFSASLIAEVLPRLWERHPDQMRESLEDLRRLTRGALAEMRGLLVELQPLALLDSELEDLLRLLGDALTGRTNIPVALTVTGQISLPAEVRAVFYGVCKEALNNIAKHSWAVQVEIVLLSVDEAVELHVRDDGRGFDTQQIPPGHYGLSIMQERAADVGAELSIKSRPDEGTEISIHWRRIPE